MLYYARSLKNFTVTIFKPYKHSKILINVIVINSVIKVGIPSVQINTIKSNANHHIASKLVV